MPKPFNIEQLPLDDGSVLGNLLRFRWVEAFRLAFGDAGTTLEMDIAFNLTNPLVQTTLAEMATLITQVAETTKDEIRTLVGRQAEEGWSMDRLASEIEQLGAGHSRERALRIARTETASAYSRGSLLAFEQSGVVGQVEWLAKLDDKTSDDCRALHGQRRPLDGEFADGTLHPPRHPNCRCAILAVLAET